MENKMIKPFNEIKTELQLDGVELQMIATSLVMEIEQYESNGKNQGKKYFLIDILKKVNNAINCNG